MDHAIVRDLLANTAEAARVLGQDAEFAAKLDTLRSQVQLQTERQRLIQAQTQRITALAGLGRLLDLRPGTGIELMDSLAAPALPSPGVRKILHFGERLVESAAI